MADYRDLAAALGGYGQDTGGITPDTLATLRNGKKASAADLLGMLKAIGSGSLSNLESLVRGGVAQIPGTAGDLEGLARMGINKSFGAGGVNVSQTPVLPTTTDILGMMPRVTATRPETSGMEELGGYMAPAFGKVAKPAVTGYAKLAGQEINAAMTGQPTRSLLGEITPKPKLLDVYHGTPHTLPPTERNPLGEFDASKIGTGEGAQSFGYGIYTAENPAVAEGYMTTLAGNVNAKGSGYYPKVNGKVVYDDFEDIDIVRKIAAATEPKAGGIMGRGKRQAVSSDEAIAKLIAKNKLIADDPIYYPEARAKALDEIQDLQKYLGKKIEPSKPSLYKVDLPDEKIATMLDWDKPMAEQKNLIEKMRKALIGEGSPLSNVQQFELNDFLSDKVRMRNLSPQSIVDLNNPKIVKRLSEAGIPGIKYFDEGSRAAGKGTRNFVTFPGEEKNMTILERNAEKSAK